MGVRRDRIDFTEVRQGGHPVMPPGMSVEARKVWRARLRADVGGAITAADGFLLKMLAESQVRYAKANKILDGSSPVLVGYRKTLTVNPAQRVVRDEAELIVRLERELRSRGRGLDTASGVEGVLGPNPGDLIRAGLPADLFTRQLPSQSTKPS
jgi:hypothetical protein